MTESLEHRIKYQMITEQIDRVKEYLIQNWDDPDSEEICDILGIAKTRTIDLELVIKGTVSVEVPITYDAENLNYLSATIEFNFDDSEVDTLDVNLEVKDTTNITDL